jgi:hypothetical protein
MPACPAVASERDYKRPGVALGLRVRVCRHCYARSWVGNIVATACVHAVARTGCAGHTKTCTARSRVAGCVCSTWLPSCSHTQVCGCCARTGAACRAAQTRAVCVSNACCRAQPSAPLLSGVCPAGADLLDWQPLAISGMLLYATAVWARRLCVRPRVCLAQREEARTAALHAKPACTTALRGRHTTERRSASAASYPAYIHLCRVRRVAARPSHQRTCIQVQRTLANAPAISARAAVARVAAVHALPAADTAHLT